MLRIAIRSLQEPGACAHFIGNAVVQLHCYAPMLPESQEQAGAYFMHLVSYSLKKLVHVEAITSTKIGKEVFYKAGDKAKQHQREFLKDRAKFLEPALKHLSDGEYDSATLTQLLRAISGVYEQAARTAASAKGIS